MTIELDLHALWLVVGLAFAAGVWAQVKWPGKPA